MLWTEFERTVNQHDLTYAYSDDGRVYRAGLASEDAIMQASVQFPIEDVERCWNAMVDRSLIPDARQPFYWKGPRRSS